MNTISYPGLANPGATYPGMAYRHRFSPPVVYRASLDSTPPFRRTQYPQGVSVIKDSLGAYRTVENDSNEALASALTIYMGGHDYYISDDEAAALTAAGYEVTNL